MYRVIGLGINKDNKPKYINFTVDNIDRLDEGIKAVKEVFKKQGIKDSSMHLVDWEEGTITSV